MKKKTRLPDKTMMKRMSTMVETAKLRVHDLEFENRTLREEVRKLKQDFDDRLSEASRKERETWIRSFYDLETRNAGLEALASALSKELIELKTDMEIKRREQK